MEGLRTAVLDYVCIVADALDKTRMAENRLKYTKHLAQAARWLGMLHRGAPLIEVKESILREQKSYGRDYIAGDDGAVVDRAFATLISGLEVK